MEKCTATNDGAVHNNSCTECTCEVGGIVWFEYLYVQTHILIIVHVLQCIFFTMQNNEWTCKKKVTCSPVTCKSTIIMGCCEVCDGSTNTRILSSSSTSGQPAFVST